MNERGLRSQIRTISTAHNYNLTEEEIGRLTGYLSKLNIDSDMIDPFLEVYNMGKEQPMKSELKIQL